MKPASRIKIPSEEIIGEKPVVPEIKFSRGKDRKSVIKITLGLTNGDFVEDSEADVDEHTRINFRDAINDSKDFFRPGHVKVKFINNGSDGAKMILEADLETKVPGTGAEFIQPSNDATGKDVKYS